MDLVDLKNELSRNFKWDKMLDTKNNWFIDYMLNDVLKIVNMSEFNENPFKKNTQVVPFSNSTDCEDWTEDNCLECKKYENESTKECDSKCKLAFHLDFSRGLGTIPLWVAKEIGCSYNPLYQTIRLEERCNHFDDGDDSKPF